MSYAVINCRNCSLICAGCNCIASPCECCWCSCCCTSTSADTVPSVVPSAVAATRLVFVSSVTIAVTGTVAVGTPGRSITWLPRTPIVDCSDTIEITVNNWSNGSNSAWCPRGAAFNHNVFMWPKVNWYGTRARPSTVSNICQPLVTGAQERVRDENPVVCWAVR